MTIINYPATSPYYITPQSSWTIGRFVFRPVAVNNNDQPYVLRSQHQYRPDRLAYELYNSPAYWWIFSARNPFLRSDPIWNFITGLEIMVPTYNDLQHMLGV